MTKNNIDYESIARRVKGELMTEIGTLIKVNAQPDIGGDKVDIIIGVDRDAIIKLLKFNNLQESEPTPAHIEMLHEGIQKLFRDLQLNLESNFHVTKH